MIELTALEEQRERIRIAELKNNWFRDPCWDIEDTAGCESYRAELLAYRLACEAAWEHSRLAAMTRKADDLGCPGNVVLARYIDRLEDKIRGLELITDGADARREHEDHWHR